ncbi:MAG: hypothetical protein CMJ20_03730 [Phycisphaeraceae bacterium]|nr:hypothetical protein [Phycisphaeraceae bacterium]|tara:strand:+ start:1667 stop:3325 length:1659 start_codon:yes stop_codon:yes gene_type:complete
MAWHKPTNLREWLDIVLRHKKKLFFVSVPVTVTVIIASHYWERKYTAPAIVEVRTQLATEQINSPVATSAVKPIRSLLRQDLTSRRAISQVIDDEGLTHDLEFTADGELTKRGQILKNKMIKEMADRVGVNYITRNNSIDRVRISYTDPIPDVAIRVTNRLVDNYIEKASSLFDVQLAETSDFFRKQVDKYSELMNQKEIERLRFEENNPGLNPEDPMSLDAQITQLQARKATLAQNRAVRLQERESLRAWVVDQPEMITFPVDQENPKLAVLRVRVEQLANELYGLRTGTGGAAPKKDRHPDVKRAKAEISRIEATMQDTVQSVQVASEPQLNQTRIETEVRIEAMNGELVGLEQQLSDVNNQIMIYQVRKRNFFPLRNQYLTCKRKIEEYKTQLAFWEGRYRDTQVARKAAAARQGISLRVIDRPPEFAMPSEPTLLKILLAAVIIGLGTATAVIILTELLDHSFRNVQHAVDELKLPVLGAVNEIMTPTEMFRRKIFGWGIVPATATAILVLLGISIFLVQTSLTEPQKYSQWISHPIKTISDALFGNL